MLTEEALQDAGHIVMAAPDAEAAIRAMEADTSVTLVFTDVDMPGTMDGLKLAAYVRRRWPPVHIIIASDKRQPADSEMPYGSLFFSKLYSTREVAAAVQAGWLNIFRVNPIDLAVALRRQIAGLDDRLRLGRRVGNVNAASARGPELALTAWRGWRACPQPDKVRGGKCIFGVA